MSPNDLKPTRWIWKVISSEERADLAILKALTKREGEATTEFPTLTRSQLQRLMNEGLVSISGIPIKANSKLKSNSVIEIEFPPPKSTELTPENKPIEILFEDEHLVVINKPQKLTVHPSTTQMEGTLVHILLHHIKDLSGIGGRLRPGIVHRLDKDTSGALVITKTDVAHARLSEIFSKHAIERTYWALCYGAPPLSKNPVKIESKIGRSLTDRKKMSMTVKNGRQAITYFRTLQEFGVPGKKPFASWLEVTLETGRTHQIRVHMNGQNHSILGDPVYGLPSANQPKWVALPDDVKEQVRLLPGQALHARLLGFDHPMTGQRLRFEAQIPNVFEKILQICQKYSNA